MNPLANNPEPKTPLQLSFPHFVGVHCSSTTVRNLLAYDGITMSEAMVFGLGAGLGFFYATEPGKSPSRRFNGRAPDLEGNVYQRLGKPLSWLYSWQPDALHQSLTVGRPLIAQTDIFFIPYYDDVHFIGHGFAVVGLGDDTVYTADIASPDICQMSLEAFHEAIRHPYPPLQMPYHYAQAPQITLYDIDQLDWDEVVLEALAQSVLYMLEPPTSSEGLAGMLAFATDLPSWPELPDLAWTARFGYQAIEKRGTGGGNFRLLFKDFLHETKDITDIDHDMVEGFEESAELWSTLAHTLKTVAFREPAQHDLIVKDLHDAQHILHNIIVLEQHLFEILRQQLAYH